jgi:aryl-alcohol dehydrogenase-like predicted oxidoreductase
LRNSAWPLLNISVIARTAARLGVTPAQVALQCLLRLAPNVLLISGTCSAIHLRASLDEECVTLDDEALRELDDIST